MNQPKSETMNRSDAPRGIGAQAARKRQELERFDEERKKLQEKWRQERDQLARDVAEVEGRDRRRRNQELTDQKRVKFILGGLVLAALREKGLAALAITAQDLDRLKPMERQLLDQTLDTSRAPAPPAADAASNVKEAMADGVDVVL